MSKQKESLYFSANFFHTLDYSRFFKRLSRFLLSVLIVVILIALTGGIFKMILDLKLIFSEPLSIALRQIIVDALVVLAVVEIYKTTFTYFTEGRVRVTYIVDTVLVIMLSEVISLWFGQGNTNKFAILISVLFALIVIRILAIRFHPASKDHED